MSGKGIKKSHMGHAPRQLRKLMEKLVSFYPEMSCREIPKICAAFYFFFRLQLRTGSQHVDADNLLKKLSCCFLESKSAHHGLCCKQSWYQRLACQLQPIYTRRSRAFMACTWFGEGCSCSERKALTNFSKPCAYHEQAPSTYTVIRDYDPV